MTLDKRSQAERMFGPLREIRAVDLGQSRFAKPGHGTAELRLSCGHHKFVKNSKVPEARTRCRECRVWIPESSLS